LEVHCDSKAGWFLSITLRQMDYAQQVAEYFDVALRVYNGGHNGMFVRSGRGGEPYEVLPYWLLGT
jgi:hypothetical protein